MSMTPEERGEATWLLAAMNPPVSRDAELAAFVQALRQAENEALERAERAVLNEHSIAQSDELNIGLLRAHRAVRACRLLKSQETGE
jgi:hypothetical protein